MTKTKIPPTAYMFNNTFPLPPPAGLSNSDQIREMAARDFLHQRLALEARQKLATSISAYTPKKTLTTYAGKILEFHSWMKEEKYKDDLVTADKFLRFLQLQEFRPAKKKGRKKRTIEEVEEVEVVEALVVEEDEGEEIDDPTVTISTSLTGWNTLAGYVSAIMKLWKQQFDVR